VCVYIYIYIHTYTHYYAHITTVHNIQTCIQNKSTQSGTRIHDVCFMDRFVCILRIRGHNIYIYIYIYIYTLYIHMHTHTNTNRYVYSKKKIQKASETLHTITTMASHLAGGLCKICDSPMFIHTYTYIHTYAATASIRRRVNQHGTQVHDIRMLHHEDESNCLPLPACCKAMSHVSTCRFLLFS
jgi:hypothetical protein